MMTELFLSEAHVVGNQEALMSSKILLDIGLLGLNRGRNLEIY
jgi:hypothetical protein